MSQNPNSLAPVAIRGTQIIHLAVLLEELAAVSSEWFPLHAGDGGNGIRIPASCCGLFGIKPTRGRVSQAPYRGESWGGFVQKTSYREASEIRRRLDIADPITPGEPYAAPHKERSWLEETQREPGKLRIAFDMNTLFGKDNHPEIKSGTALFFLQNLDDVVEARPSFNKEELIKAYFNRHLWNRTICGRYFCICRDSSQSQELRSGHMVVGTDRIRMQHKLSAQAAMHKAGRSVAAFFQQHDISPPQPPLLLFSFGSQIHPQPSGCIGLPSKDQSLCFVGCCTQAYG